MSSPPLPAPNKAQVTFTDRQKLPGLLPEETLIFKAWWLLHGAEYTDPDFNVRVGTGFDPGDTFDQAARESAIASTKKRIDAVVWKGNQAYIIEVKVRATPPVIGQVVCYRLLWSRQNQDKPQPIPLLLYCRIDADTLYCLDQLGIASQMVYVDLSQVKVSKG